MCYSTMVDISSKFESLLKRMQTPAAKQGMETAFNAASEELGRAAVNAAQRPDHGLIEEDQLY